MSAGLAGVITGDSSANAVEGAQAGKNALENNALSLPDNKARAHEITQCQGDSACEDAGELAGCASARVNVIAAKEGYETRPGSTVTKSARCTRMLTGI